MLCRSFISFKWLWRLIWSDVRIEWFYERKGWLVDLYGFVWNVVSQHIHYDFIYRGLIGFYRGESVLVYDGIPVFGSPQWSFFQIV